MVAFSIPSTCHLFLRQLIVHWGPGFLGKRLLELMIDGSAAILFFDDCFLDLVLQHGKQVLSVFRRELLPNEETLAAILPGFGICIRHAELDESVYCLGIFVEDAVKWINSNQHQ